MGIKKIKNPFRKKRGGINNTQKGELWLMRWNLIKDLADRHFKMRRMLSTPLGKRRVVNKKGEILNETESRKELTRRLREIEKEIARNVYALYSEAGYYRKNSEEAIIADLSGTFKASPEEIEVRNSTIIPGNNSYSKIAKQIFYYFDKLRKGEKI